MSDRKRRRLSPSPPPLPEPSSPSPSKQARIQRTPGSSSHPPTLELGQFGYRHATPTRSAAAYSDGIALYSALVPPSTRVLIKLAPTPTPESQARLKREYTLITDLLASRAPSTRGPFPAPPSSVSPACIARPTAVRDLGKHGLGLVFPSPEGAVTLADAYLSEEEGGGLGRGAARRGSVPRLVAHAISIARALEELHTAGVAPVCLRPETVRALPEGQVLLDDMQHAVRLGMGGAGGPSLTLPLLCYIAPEVTGRLGRSIDARSSLYALGVTLFELLTGVLPFPPPPDGDINTDTPPSRPSSPSQQRDAELELMHRLATERAADPCALVPGIPKTLGKVVLKLLEKTPENRYQSERGLIADLERILRGGQPTSSDSPSTTSSDNPYFAPPPKPPPPPPARTASQTARLRPNRPMHIALPPPPPFPPAVLPLQDDPTPAARSLTITTAEVPAEADNFPIGALDARSQFALPHKLYARQTQLHELLDAFERVKQGTVTVEDPPPQPPPGSSRSGTPRCTPPATASASGGTGGVLKAVGKSELVVVRGYSGIGKSALAKQLRKPVVQSKGYFTSAKFDQFKGAIPFISIYLALSELIRQILTESSDALAHWRRRLSRALGNDVKVLAAVVPGLENVFEDGWLRVLPDPPELGPVESEGRFKRVVQNFVRTFARRGRPLVMCFDDVQWSSPTDLGLIQNLISNATASGQSLLLVLIYRDNEVGPKHIVTEMLKQVTVDVAIDLGPFKLEDVEEIVCDTLGIERGASAGSAPAEEYQGVRALSELILDKTGGNPFHVSQLLRTMHTSGLLRFDFSAGRWTWDLASLANVSTSVVDLLSTQMGKFSEPGQKVLKVAACLGNEHLSLATLARAMDVAPADIARELQEALQAGLVVLVTKSDGGSGSQSQPDVETPRSSAMEVDSDEKVETEPRSEGGSKEAGTAPPAEEDVGGLPRYRFLHDRVQQAAYGLIPREEQAATHHRIGQRLFRSATQGELDEHIFELVGQLNHGLSILSTQEELDELARLNLLAGRKALHATAFEPSIRYLTLARDLLGAGGWLNQYDLMNETMALLVDAEYSNSNYIRALQHVEVYLKHVKDDLDRLKMYARSVRCATGTGDAFRAIEIGLKGLRIAGVNVPLEADAAAKLADQLRQTQRFTVEQIQTMIDLPLLEDPILLAAQNLVVALVSPVYFSRPDLLAPVMSSALQITVQRGLCPAGAYILTIHALNIVEKYREIREAYAYGNVAVGFLRARAPDDPLGCPIYKVYASHIQVWCEPLRNTNQSFLSAISIGIRTFNAEYLAYGSCELLVYQLFAGENLNLLVSQASSYSVLLSKFKQDIGITYHATVYQAILNLLGRSDNVVELNGEVFGKTELEIIESRSYHLHRHLVNLFGTMLAVMFKDRTRAREAIRMGRESYHGAPGLLYTCVFRFWECIYIVDDEAATPEELTAIAETAEEFSTWRSELAPETFSHKGIWLKAELLRREGRLDEALEMYDNAIAESTEYRFTHLAAFINERAAEMLIRRGKSKFAAGYLSEAYGLWLRWGCKPKLDALANDYPSLFSTASPSSPSGFGIDPSPLPLPEQYLSAEAQGVDPFSVPLVTPAIEHGPFDFGITDASDTIMSQSDLAKSDGGRLIGLPHSQSAPRSNGERPSRHASRGKRQKLSEHESTDESFSNLFIGGETRSALGTELDLRTVLRASLIVSEEVRLDKIVSKLMNIVLQASGAERTVLVLEKAGKLCIEASGTSQGFEVQHHRSSVPIDETPELSPCSIIHYVARTKNAVLNDFSLITGALDEPFFADKSPKSILALPLQSQGALVGVLYLQNDQVTSAFSHERTEILKLISTQAAISVDKARLYDDLVRSKERLEEYNRLLETKVEQRTQHLEVQIREKERAQAAMRRLKELAENATKLKSLFLANMSHEIRTPFNSIFSLSGLLLDTPLNPLQLDYAETIRNSSSELLVIINDILDFSKIENDRLELERTPVSVRSCIEGVLELVSEKAAAKKLDLAFIFNQGDVTIMSDLTRLRQVLVNLASNAIKFTAAGEVVITASFVEELVESELPDVRLTVAVKDTGIGIPRSDWPKLFQTFSQADNTTFRRFGGTGLGLAISRKLSKLMSGDLTLKNSVEGIGSTFELELLVPRAPTGSPVFAPEANLDLKGKSALVIDHHAPTSVQIVQLLEALGFVATASNGSDSLPLVSDRRWDIIFLDIFLPAQFSQPLVDRIGSLAPEFKAVVVLTRLGAPAPDMYTKLTSTYLLKPVRQNRLYNAVRQLIVRPGNDPALPFAERTAPAFKLAERYPHTMLLAEDNPVNVKVAQHILLRLLGYKTDVAMDGQFAVDAVKSKQYSVLLMDVNMPRKDGLEAATEICKLFPNPKDRPWLIALTANACVGDREVCLAAGFDDYASKPILVPELTECLSRAPNRLLFRNFS